jgi:hypothetical protein
VAERKRRRSSSRKPKSAAIHLQVKTQAEIELAKIKADLDAKLKILDAHIDLGARKPPPMPGARKAKDGHHYVPDAKRPGKYLMVVPHG